MNDKLIDETGRTLQQAALGEDADVYESPRRCQLDQLTNAERVIYDAAGYIERMRSDTRLTKAVILLQQARDKVADFVDGVEDQDQARIDQGQEQPKSFSIRELQTQLPWSTHYHHDFRSSPMAHKNFGHALLHVVKAAGKLSSVVDDAEHKGSEFTADEVDKYVADLVICAMRMANTCPGRTFDLERAVVDRLESKNSIKLK